jgi:acetate kinase
VSRLLIVNAGSSSLKLRVLDAADRPADEQDVSDWDGTDTSALDDLLSRVRPDAVVHRVVHGGPELDGAVLVDDDVVRRLEALVPLAPLHQPRALALLRHTQQALPDVPDIACFDTAFHHSLPAATSTYALPADWRERWGLRRYGFHGLSHQYVAGRTADLVRRDDLRVVTCHLGSGASVCAVDRGRSVDTSMGFTPVEGLVMATRSGSVDPGLLVWLLTEAGLSADDLGDALEHRSGLLGLAGTADLREIVEARDSDDRAALAFDVYVARLAGEIARTVTALGGLDALTFTGGVGERSAPVRAATAAKLAFLGIQLDPARNAAADPVISPDGAPVTVCVVESREDVAMAHQARAVLQHHTT